MTSRTLLASLACLLLHSSIIGQESIHILEQDYFSIQADDNYHENLFGVALSEFETLPIDDVIDLTARSSFELDETRSIDLLLESVIRSEDADRSYELFRDIGNKYFDRKEYRKAKGYYARINDETLFNSKDQATIFRKGYVHLVDKDFKRSEIYFDAATELKGDLTPHAQYYAGITKYHQGKVDESIQYFRKVENHKRYRDLIPYYFAQLFFKNEEYDEAITYGKKALSNPKGDQSRINRMVGLSYLAKGNKREALPYLEAYATNSKKLTENEFYQLGYLTYELDQYEKSANYLKEIAHRNSDIGQMSNYLLGSISVKTGDKKKAQAAFKQASKFDFFPDVKQESQFLYHKLSADLGDVRAAINGLVTIPESSIYHAESEKLLSDLLTHSGDSEMAINVIERMDTKSPELLKVYQEQSYDLALNSMQEGDQFRAKEYFEKARSLNSLPTIKNRSLFYLGYVDDMIGDVSSSKSKYNEYLESGDREFIFESHYYLGHQAVNNKYFSKALDEFDMAIKSYSSSSDSDVLYEDAILRCADLELMSNNYNSALDYYELAKKNNVPQADYIAYQQAMIYGLVGQPYDKLTNLESLIKKYPDSDYKDDAYFEIGEALLEMGKSSEAYRVFDSLSEDETSAYNSTAWLRKGLISFNQGDMESSLLSYEKVIENSGDREEQREALMAMEEIYLNELNNPSAYFKYLESEIGYEYEDVTKDSISYEVAFDKYRNGEYEVAVDMFDNYLSDFKDGIHKDDAHYYTAECHVLRNDYDSALPSYEAVLSYEDSEHYASSLKKAALISYNHAQNFDKSLSYFEKLIGSGESNNLEYLESALYSAFKVQNDEMIQKFGSAVINHEGSSKNARATAYYYKGKSNQRLGHLDAAIDAYNEVVRLSSNHQAAEASYLIAEILYGRGIYDSAERQAFETTKQSSNYPVYVAKSLLLLGDIFIQQKDYLNATAALESVYENYQDDQEINQKAKEKLDEVKQLIETESKVSEQNTTEPSIIEDNE